MAKHRAGLHKEVSSIFGGVPPSRDNGAGQSAQAPRSVRNPQDTLRQASTAERIGYVPAQSREGRCAPPPKAAPAQQPQASTIKTLAQILWQRLWGQIQNKLFAPEPGVSAIKQKATVILVPILFVILIFVFTRALGTSSHKVPKPAGFTQNLIATSADEIDWEIPDTYPATIRDPMQFGSAAIAQGKAGGLIVKGIVYSEDNPSAVIGARIVHTGDKVLGVTIVKINEDSVELEMDGKKWTQKVR